MRGEVQGLLRRVQRGEMHADAVCVPIFPNIVQLWVAHHQSGIVEC